MKDHGFLRVSAISPRVSVGDPHGNAKAIADAAHAASAEGSAIALFPELCISGASCGDLFSSDALCDLVLEALAFLREESSKIACAIVVGLPLRLNARLYNCAVLLQGGRVRGVVPKTLSPSDAQNRWFSGMPLLGGQSESVSLLGETVPFGNIVFRDGLGRSFGIEIGSDAQLGFPPSQSLAMSGAALILRPSARLCSANFYGALVKEIEADSRRYRCGIVYAGAGSGESTSEGVFGGECMLAENGTMLDSGGTLMSSKASVTGDFDFGLLSNPANRFPCRSFHECRVVETDTLAGVSGAPGRYISPRPFLEGVDSRAIAEIFEIQAVGLAERLQRAGCAKAVIGVSGGSDSTLALLVAARAAYLLKRPADSILAVSMPGFGTTARTRGNAEALARALGCDFREISISANTEAHLRDIGHDMSVFNATYENAQARERTQILMDLANEVGGLVIGTGDMSEAALGWCTYGGDHLSMYSVNRGLTKGLVRAVIAEITATAKMNETFFSGFPHTKELAAILRDVLDTPVSPELLPPNEDGSIAQITEDKVGPYALHDFFLWHLVFLGRNPDTVLWLAEQAFYGDYDSKTIEAWLSVFRRRFIANQFKRGCSPDGPKVTDYGLSPRGEWLMPSDASDAFWK